VVNVSWNDAVAFCKWLTEESRRQGTLGLGEGYRLPTEAEWEYSARAGSKGWYFHGDDPEGLVKYANVADKSLGKRFTPVYRLVSGDDGFVFTSPVGSYRANAFGLFDMHGNVYEWCSDWYGDYPKGAVTDPTDPATGSLRVYRGGGWDGGAARRGSAYRLRLPPGRGDFNKGFRLALSSSGIPQ
jgi:formylglycine-generating enzyme required for sulfatase activity